MNDAWGYQNEDDTQSQGEPNLDGPKGLRDAYKAQQQLLNDIRNQLNLERAERQKEKLKATFESLGVPGAVDLYQGDADPQKAAEWVNTMKAAFGSTNGGEGNSQSTPPALNADQQAQLQRMTEAGSNGVPMGGLEAAQAAIGNATSIEDLINANRHMGG